ncbi:MAG TPA: hypothetical protein VK824_12570, partial [Planctomycetota bacterium]|nr:hypothetical protein [Planctomycetota bacterium]
RPLQHMELAAQGRRVRLPLPGGVSISREALDAALVTAACERGAHFLPGAFAAGTGAPAPGAPRAVDMTRIDGPEGTARLHARVVLVADGLGGRLLDADELGPATIARDSRLGAGTVLAHAPEAVAPGTLWMACGAAGYVGLVRLQDDRLDVAAAFEARALAAAGGARGAGALAASLLAGAGLHELAELPLAGAMWRGTPQLTRTPARRGARAALLLGDACGYVEPFTGEGIASALGSALAVLPFAEAAARGWDDALLPAWERCWTRTIGARQRSTRALAWLLRHPRLLAPCMTVLALRPALAAPLLAGLAAPTRVTPPARATDPATRDDAVAPARRSASARAPR